MRTQNPSVVRQTARGVGARVVIDQLPRRRHSDLVCLEREPLRILDHLKQMGVRAAEFVLAVHAERVVPDDPTAADQPMLPLHQDLQLGSVLVANGQPERPVVLQDPHDLADPLAAPLQILVVVHVVAVHVVFVTDVERRIGKRQIDDAGRQFAQPGNAVLVANQIGA